jgi:hypothetical protein
MAHRLSSAFWLMTMIIMMMENIYLWQGKKGGRKTVILLYPYFR